MPSALVILHIAFEDLGTLEPVLRSAGYEIDVRDASTFDFNLADAFAPDLLVVMGGPIGAYETEAYPFLQDELEFLRLRLSASRATLGICLGAQLMAAALGAWVYPGKNGKEIGWAPLRSGRDAGRYPWLANLFQDELRVLHWHGDTFDLPPGALHLASTARYENQAFAVGKHGLALQFHPEVTTRGLERWYVGHAGELAGAGIKVTDLRKESADHAPKLETAAAKLWNGWLGSLGEL
jgi:GMP synthase (glutamine-hydrolysing)